MEFFQTLGKGIAQGFILFISIVAAVASCNPKQETQQVAFQMPAVDDIAMYQVNPRVFAPENSLNAVAARW